MPYRSSHATRLVAIVAIVALALMTLAPGALARGRAFGGSSFTVTHEAVTITLANPASDGHQLGDLRVTSIPVADEAGNEIGRLDSTLTTVGIDTPEPGDEIRISVLIFSFGDGADQLVVNGTGFYPRAGATIASDSTIVRPITGGSGAYAGTTGWAETEHLDDGTWRHTFHLGVARSRAMPREPHGGHSPTGPAAASPAPAADTGIVRTLLGEVDPTNAEGQTLALWHYTIPAGEALVPHVHPGFQVARIESGTLTYDVIEGEVTILRADGSVEIGTTGQVVTLEAGDTVIENPGLSHFGANNGTEPVVIHAASLFTTGEPPAIPLPSAAP